VTKDWAWVCGGVYKSAVLQISTVKNDLLLERYALFLHILSFSTATYTWLGQIIFSKIDFFSLSANFATRA
jgi:hypothetical protein